MWSNEASSGQFVDKISGVAIATLPLPRNDAYGYTSIWVYYERYAQYDIIHKNF